MANAFSSQGALPTSNLFGMQTTTPMTAGGTSASRALNTAAQPSAPQIGPSSLASLNNAGLIPKSHSITDAAGNNYTATYHDPNKTAGTTSAPSTQSVLNVSDGKGGYVSGTPQGVASTLNATPQSTTQNNPVPVPPAQTTFPGLVNQAATAATNSPYTTDVQGLLGKEQDLASQLGPALATVTNTPGLLANQNARASNLTNAYGQEMQGLASTLAGANTAQGNLQSGLLGAGSLAKPTGNFPFAFNPLTEQFSNAAPGGTSATGSTTGNSTTPTFNPTQDAQNFGTAVMNGTMTYQQALDSLGYIPGGAASTYLNSAITGMGGNPLSLEAEGTTKQSVIGTQGTQVAQWTSALQQGQNLQSQLSDLLATFKLNPSDVNAVNSGLQTIAANTSNPYYQQLSNYVNDVANTYAQILTPPGGSQTDTTRGIASGMLDATAAGTSIISTMQQLDAAAKAKIAGVPVDTNKLFSGSSSAPSGSSATGSSTTAGSGWDSLTYGG